jgi:hypothetical protein
MFKSIYHSTSSNVADIQELTVIYHHANQSHSEMIIWLISSTHWLSLYCHTDHCPQPQQLIGLELERRMEIVCTKSPVVFFHYVDHIHHNMFLQLEDGHCCLSQAVNKYSSRNATHQMFREGQLWQKPRLLLLLLLLCEECLSRRE